MTINGITKNQKLQCDINREATTITALSSRKTEKNECPTGEKNLLTDQSKYKNLNLHIYLLRKTTVEHTYLRKEL